MGLNCHRHFCWTPLQSRLCVSLPGYGAHSKTASASFGWITGNAISTVPLHATLQISHAQVWQLPQSVMWCSRPHARSSTCCVLLQSCHIGLEVEQSAELWGSNRRIPCKRMQKAIRHSPSTLWSQPCGTQAAAVSSFYEVPREVSAKVHLTFIVHLTCLPEFTQEFSTSKPLQQRDFKHEQTLNA